ncbi:MAG: AAA family ATPase [Propionivibrio sp.]|nr:AAA family ATPase [Propionivibrio sp.]
MLEFRQSALLDQRLAQGELRTEEIDALSVQIAEFHAQVARAGAGSEYGAPAAVWALVAQNFKPLQAGTDDANDRAILNELETWSRNEFVRLEGFLESRRVAGFVRECHGDLHLGNIALVHGAPKIFDCIEFNANLRWIDVISEVAFLSMDLEERGRPDFAHRFLNRYLEATGDYAGIAVPAFLSRLSRPWFAPRWRESAPLRKSRTTRGERREIRSQYLAFASRASRPRRTQLLLMHGVSGSGKTWVSEAVLEHIGALRLRSDIERKRLCGVPALTHSTAAPDNGLYDAATTRATYLRLEQLAQTILEAGFPLVIDAASLKHWQREIFRNLARTLHVPFRILSCRASEPALRKRGAGQGTGR